MQVEKTGGALERRERFDAASAIGTRGEFEILAMTAGQGNRWHFSAEVLRASLPLWDGCESFVDHTRGLGEAHSVRDLCGVCGEPEWNQAAQGIQLRLKPMGPSAALVRELGRELLAESAADGDMPKPAVGFSADIGFTATGTEVDRILRVFSLDLVFEPARGGAFLRVLNSSSVETINRKGDSTRVPLQDSKEGKMTEQVIEAGSQNDRQNSAAQYSAQQIEQLHLQLCARTLEAELAASRLPHAARERLRQQFGGKVFEPQDLTTAIADARALVSELTAGQTVAGVTRLAQMYSAADQLQAAVEDMFQVERSENTRGVQAARLSGIKELYLGLTADYDLHGAVDPERARFQHTTSNFAGLVKNALNKALLERWRQLGRAGYDWWERVAHVEHFDSLNQITWMIFGTVGSLPSVAEGAEYTELKVGDSPETSSFTKYGGYIGITLEAIDRDETRKLRAVPRELANAALRNISALTAALFTSNSGVGPTMADGGALFNNTAVTTAGGHANLRTTALGASEWDTVQAAVYNQPMLVANESGYYGTGGKMALNPRYLLVPRALQLTAKQILYPSLERASSIYSENQQQGRDGDVVVVPDWTDTNDWAAVADPLLAPGICIGERFGLAPEIYIAGDELSPAVFMNDESRIKVRHFVAVGVADFRPLHKSNV